MSSFLDIQILGYFSKIFVFVLIFVLIYAVLSLTKLLGGKNNLDAIVALTVAFIVIFNQGFVDLVEFMIPWFVLMAIVILLILMNYKLFGGEGDVVSMLVGAGRHKTVVYWIITLSVIIVLMALSSNYGQTVGPYLDGETRNASTPLEHVSGLGDAARGTGDVGTGDFQTNLGATLFHPRMLGMVLILLIASFTMLLLARKA
ncbi:hypothetical protein GOV05_04580 [Candidatus Woesearchaeota archaeon]|nr:hypothetical protein [Candidatus Woesearchaeota archaeon]